MVEDINELTDEEIEEKVQPLLSARARLDNGQEGYIFTYEKSGFNKGRYFCCVCSSILCSSRTVLQHATGKNHVKKMQLLFHPHEKFTKIVISENKNPVNSDAGVVVTAPGVEMVDLAPGEPVPPGFEDLVKRVPQIMCRLEKMKSALIGLEFLAEIVPKPYETECSYVCMLCDKKGDSRTVPSHLISFNHRILYLDRYFPRLKELFSSLPRLPTYRRGISECLCRVVTAIEKKFGRLTPTVTSHDKNREDLYKEMLDNRHFHETPGSSCEALIDIEFIKKCATEPFKRLAIDVEKDEAKLISALKLPLVIHKEIIEDENEETAKEDEQNEKGENEDTKKWEENNEVVMITASPATSKEPLAKRQRQRSISLSSSSRSRSLSRSRSPRRPARRTRSRSISPRRRRRDGRDQTRYRKLPYRRTRSRSRSRSRYRSPSPFRRRGSPNFRSRYAPRSPLRKYSIRRSPLQTNRPVSFTIKSTPTIRDREEEEEREKKEKVKRQVKTYIAALEKELALRLKTHEKTPEKHPQYSDEWKKFWNRRYKELTSEGKDASKHDFKPEWIKYWTVRVKDLMEEEKKERIKKYCIDLGVPELAKGNLDDLEDDEIVEITPNNKDFQANGSRASPKEKKITKGEEEVNKLDTLDKDDIIGVLRLLAALEYQLGSLGPRVNNLLATSLALEKQKKGSAYRLLYDKSNFVLFETLKEKLKGQLFAGIVERSMVKATRKAIAAIVTLCSAFEEKVKSQVAVQPPTATLTPTTPIAPLVVAGVGTVDKLALAQQIAATLVAQGKTDLSEDDLEQLINAVVGMAQGMKPGMNALNSALEEQSAENSPPSNFQELLSSVVKAHSEKVNAPGFKLMQLRSEVNSSKPLTLRDMSDLTENDLKTLLQNFKDLSNEEQQFLVTYLKGLEVTNPGEVEKLRNYIDGGDIPPSSLGSGRLSPFSSREGGANPSNTLPPRKNVFDDDDEDDYSFEDICKAAKKNVPEKPKKSASSKEAAAEMIKNEEKKAAESVKRIAPSCSKGVSIDPNDLLSSAPDVLMDAQPIPSEVVHKIGTTGMTRIRAPAPVPPPVLVPTSPVEPTLPEKSASAGWENYPAYSYEENASYNYNPTLDSNYQGYTDVYQQPAPAYSESTEYNYPPVDYSQAPPNYDSHQTYSYY